MNDFDVDLNVKTKTALGDSCLFNVFFETLLAFKNIHTDPRWKNLAKLKKSKDHSP